MRKALVIGSAGNIGVPLVRLLKTQGVEVLEVDIRPEFRPNYLVADINHPIDLIPAFDWQPDVVFLLSAMVSRVTCEQAGSLAIATNLSGLQNVIELCKRSDAMLVYFSSSEVYGPECDPMDERASGLAPNNRYGLTKLLGEKLVEYEVTTHGLRAVTLRPFMVYDENETIGDHRSAMIRFATNLASGLPIEVHEGSARGWLHSSDAVRAITAAAGVQDYAAINIGHPHIVPMADLAEMIRKHCAAPRELITHRRIPARMTLIKRPILQHQRNLLGIEPRVSLEQGVRRVCQNIIARIHSEEPVLQAA